MPLLDKKINVNINKDYEVTLKYHIIFWIIYFSFNMFRWGSYFGDYEYSLKTNAIGFPIHMILCYLNIYILMPLFIFRKKYFMYVVTVLGAIFLMVFFKFNLTYFLVGSNVWPEGPEVINELTLNYTIDMMIGELYVMTFVTAIKITMDWLHEHNRLTNLEKLQLETELQFLRTQVSPHFFLNTLNNIYALSIAKSDKTPKIIIKLSSLMKYMLYETKVKRQSLEKEIECIQNYLDLERIRHGENLNISMNISGSIYDKTIAPMLLMSFIENAFKHGVNKSINNVTVTINFKIINDYLYFIIENPKPEKNPFESSIRQEVGGIGLKNVKKRLELGYKSNEYKLKINDLENKFVVKLKIKIK